jgi:hypothetical protein
VRVLDTGFLALVQKEDPAAAGPSFRICPETGRGFGAEENFYRKDAKSAKNLPQRTRRAQKKAAGWASLYIPSFYVFGSFWAGA